MTVLKDLYARLYAETGHYQAMRNAMTLTQSTAMGAEAAACWSLAWGAPTWGTARQKAVLDVQGARRRACASVTPDILGTGSAAQRVFHTPARRPGVPKRMPVSESDRDSGM